MDTQYLSEQWTGMEPPFTGAAFSSGVALPKLDHRLSSIVRRSFFYFSLPLCLHFWLKGNRVPPPEENAAQKQHSAVPGQRWEIQPPENGAPLFSVVIPAYNVQEYIGDTLQSVFCQTCADFEIIVVEDGSTDDTARILAELKDPRLRVIRQKNKGVSAARNAGFAVARGKYIAMLDSDDLWKPWHLELARRFFISHPEVCWHSSKCEIVEKIPGDYLSSAMPEDTHSSAIHFSKTGASGI